MRPAVFFDRDDTLIRNTTLPPPANPHPAWKPGDLSDPSRVELLPGALQACRLLRDAGFSLVVVSNQGCVARGSATIEDVQAVNARVGELLVDDAGNPMIERFAFCPYHPQGNVPEFTREHRLRKPNPGMILDAAAELGLDLSRSWLVGDMPRDCEAGINADLPPERCLLIGEHGEVPDALAAARLILSQSR
ncbi:MAG TPA: HAD-IIIA family hydrolase [Phycisphaerales bacterium]|nr:HAD-IIIA family hydrolase [Phycisphaerales bacterium]